MRKDASQNHQPVDPALGPVDQWPQSLRNARCGHRTLRWMTSMLAVALFVFGMHPTPAHAATEYPEEAVKAVFLYRFAGYVTWPASGANAPQFTIAVLGAENVAEQLKAFLVEHPIQGKPAHVLTIPGVGQVGSAQMVYIGSGFSGKLSVLIEALKERPILIVTDRPGGLEEGSTVNFLIEQQHVRFEISTAAAKRAGLLIGSGLLAVAQYVKTGDLRERTICRPFGEHSPPCPARLATQLNYLGYPEEP